MTGNYTIIIPQHKYLNFELIKEQLFSLCTTLSLQWEPEIIAVALMYLAGKLSKFEVLDWSGRQPKHLRWWDTFVEDVTMDLLEGMLLRIFFLICI